MRKHLAVCLLVALMIFLAFGESSVRNVNISSSTSHKKLHQDFASRLIPVTADCACVQFYQCINGTFDKHGINQIIYKSSVPRYLQKDLQPNNCPDYHTWCCSEASTSKPVEVKPTSSQALGQLQVETHSYETMGCGFKKIALAFQYKIIGINNEAQPKEFPWMVMVMKNDENEPQKLRYQCGGSLIHERVVLTAAHCAAKIDRQTAVIRAGERDTRIDEEDPYQDRLLSKILTHPAYDEDTLHNDISLLVTAEPFKFAPNVNILCLPNEDEVIVDSDCLATGWGKNSEGESQRVLKKTTLPIVPRDECQLKLRETEELGADFYLHESFICAGGIKGKDTCQGDGGSPLICPINEENGRYQQVGIVAWGIRCGEALPAVYVNVARFKTWIDAEMKKLVFSTAGYRYTG